MYNQSLPLNWKQSPDAAEWHSALLRPNTLTRTEVPQPRAGLRGSRRRMGATERFPARRPRRYRECTASAPVPQWNYEKGRRCSVEAREDGVYWLPRPGKLLDMVHRRSGGVRFQHSFQALGIADDWAGGMRQGRVKREG
ncbi:hypothetical protein SKAU_G00058020 [Synaphobranchus kaupii]|uniref:Uncharacterized protein n=1 Tax=Synaphobranchus kaupii TaxID=118154 RepID=A0A9Q1G5C9_SYNKA|nr:hypothetical protein SKAU_G00058020 [Synaphobranchus kaupii]